MSVEQLPELFEPSLEIETADEKYHRRRWWILAVIGIAQLMVILDGTIVNIALPTAQHALHFSNSDRQWIVTAYSLAFGSLLLLGGRISDYIGRKNALITGPSRTLTNGARRSVSTVPSQAPVVHLASCSAVSSPPTLRGAGRFSSTSSSRPSRSPEP